MIVDDNLPIRHAIRGVLTIYNDVEIVGEAGDGNEAVKLALTCRPDVILMDLNMPMMNGIEAAKLISSSSNAISIIGLCGVRDSYTIDAFRMAGALTTISKSRLNQLRGIIQGACCHKTHNRARAR